MGGNGEESARWQLSPRRGDNVGGAAEFSVWGSVPMVGAVGKATGRGFLPVGCFRVRTEGGKGTEVRQHRAEGEGSRAGGIGEIRQRGLSAQWGGAESRTSGARLAAGMGQRRGASGAWVDPGRNEVGRAQMNNNVWDLFK
jgi:hypothetical protein